MKAWLGQVRIAASSALTSIDQPTVLLELAQAALQVSLLACSTDSPLLILAYVNQGHSCSLHQLWQW
jgi:hypothetical protein